MSLEEVKRSTRTRKLSSRVRVFDEHTRAEITRKKLDALEKDNWLEDKRKGEDDDDEEYDPLRDAGSEGGERGKRVKGGGGSGRGGAPRGAGAHPRGT